jgi:hypothetical protein
MIIRRSTHPLPAKAKMLTATAHARTIRVVDRLRRMVDKFLPANFSPRREGWIRK